MYTCGITPYDATHLGHATVYVVYDVLQRRLRDLGHDTRCVRNITDVDDPLLREGQAARCALPRSRCGRGGAVRQRHEGAQRASGVQRAACDLRDPRHPWLHRDGARPRPRVSGRRRGVLRRHLVPRLRRGQQLHARRDDRARTRARWQRRRPVQAQPPRLRALAAVGRRGADVGDDVGTRSSRVAHRVLGARAPRARHDDRSPRWRLRPDLPAPRV